MLADHRLKLLESLTDAKTVAMKSRSTQEEVSVIMPLPESVIIKETLVLTSNNAS